MKFKEHTRQARDKVKEKFKAVLGPKKIPQSLNIEQLMEMAVVGRRDQQVSIA